MNKKMGIFCTGLVVVAGALFILKDDESGNKMNENAKKELVMNHDVKDESTKSFKLADEKGVLYISTDADMTKFSNDGKGYAAFFDKDGSITGYQTTGLEDGRVVAGSEKVIVQDATDVHFINGDTKSDVNVEQRKENNYGIYSGYIEKTNTYFSITNTHDDVESLPLTVIFGEGKRMPEDQLPKNISVETAGVVDDKVLLVAHNKKTKQYELLQLTFKNDKAVTKKVTDLSLNEDSLYLSYSDIIEDEQSYHFVMSEMPKDTSDFFWSDTVLFSVNKKTNELTAEVITEQPDEDSDVQATPYNLNHSLYHREGALYYFDGRGVVYERKKGASKFKKKFAIKNPLLTHDLDGDEWSNEQQYFDGDSLFVLRYVKDGTVEYNLERYSLLT
ncbi:hypothetical protein [Kurthia sp. Dielmo]|uniref:hypothetical protein n=1 Tax=Kurthia sp. Dielmo TaxID=1033738 RepID=UPI00164919FD|nr:hypothetical protein [Kurthia sp. Dielmo]